MSLRNVLGWALMPLFIANCSIDVSIDDLTANDFLKSTILATSRGVGDGQTEATVVVLLRNSNGKPVSDYKPTFVFLDNSGSSYSGNGITYSDCQTSNSDGIATCRVRAITVGMRRVLFNNIVIELVGEIFFDAPSRQGSFGQMLTSAQIDANANGYSVTSQVGAPTSGLLHVTSGGYQVFTHTTGAITTTQ